MRAPPPKKKISLVIEKYLRGFTGPDRQGPFEKRSSLKNRIDFAQGVVDTFWKRWTQEVFPNLVIQRKWHTESRSLRQGDIVLVQDSNAVRENGKWPWLKGPSAAAAGA